jgi:hypothetical protein
VFAARGAAGELMLYDSQGEQSTGRGAITAGVDTSHSMYVEGPGVVTREAWAKACALALLDQARHAGRDFVGHGSGDVADLATHRSITASPRAYGTARRPDRSCVLAGEERGNGPGAGSR